LQVTEEPDDPMMNRSARLNHVLEQSNAVQQIQSKQHSDAVSKLKDTMQKALMREVLPALSEGLLTLVEERPADPLEHLSAFLLRWADEQDKAHADPYDAPIYQERIQLNEAKAERERQRAEARAAKAEREKAARIKADDALLEMLVEAKRKHQSMLRC
jgi:Dpy-30 motif